MRRESSNLVPTRLTRLWFPPHENRSSGRTGEDVRRSIFICKDTANLS